MPSPRSQRSPVDAGPARPRRNPLRALWLLALALGAVGCVSTTQAPAGRVAVAGDDLPFLVDPALGATAQLGAAQARDVAEAAQDVRSGELQLATTIAERLKTSAPGPAEVLLAEVQLVRGDTKSVVERLEPLLESMPDYTAARVVLGRAYERLGELISAYEQYVSAAGEAPVAARRVAELRGRVVDVLSKRITSALQAGRTADAEAALSHLQTWAPGEEASLQAALAVSQAKQDPRGELAALRGLVKRHPQDEELARRRARLELHWGDPTVGFQILQDLAAAHPEDESLASEAAGARYYWRLAMLPAQVRELTQRPTLTRAEYAGLLYWLMPSVRSLAGSGKIASDVLDSPWRTEIIRVVNLGLMSIDTSQHRFDPAEAVTQKAALLALLRLIQRHAPPPQCLGGTRFDQVEDPGMVCAAADACHLLGADAGCLPDAPVSGADAVEYAHRALQCVGGS